MVINREPMEIKGKRLLLKPLNKRELEVYIGSREQFEKHLGLTVSGVELKDDCCEELSEIIASNPAIWESPAEYLLYTLWLLVDTHKKSIVGQFWFNGKPNANGEVEMFFAIEKPYRRQGYATESVNLLLNWAQATKPFRVLLVETSDHNAAALAALRKLGFRPVESDSETVLDFDDVDSAPVGSVIAKYYYTIYRKDEEDVYDFEV